jgi:hypothetical protein
MGVTRFPFTSESAIVYVGLGTSSAGMSASTDPGECGDVFTGVLLTPSPDDHHCEEDAGGPSGCPCRTCCCKPCSPRASSCEAQPARLSSVDHVVVDREAARRAVGDVDPERVHVVDDIVVNLDVVDAVRPVGAVRIGLDPFAALAVVDVIAEPRRFPVMPAPALLFRSARPREHRPTRSRSVTLGQACAAAAMASAAVKAVHASAGASHQGACSSSAANASSPHSRHVSTHR